ncbi:MAG: hypothetical protein JO110_17750 [Acetobacteraceae bacterium]|nr:hypothetical protein [Acetobacteraceae bacterium]
MGESITFVGLDVHKATMTVAIADGGSREVARCYGIIENTPAALSKLAHKLARNGARLQFCYEAGPCGYGVCRHLQAREFLPCCGAIADPAPLRRPGEDPSAGGAGSRFQRRSRWNSQRRVR